MSKQNRYLTYSLILIALALVSLNQRTLSAKPLGQSTSAEYRITFTAEWSEATHPDDFPSGNPHFSGLIGGTHNDNVSFWVPGALASEGIEEMAESGGTGALDDEVQDAIDAGMAGRVLAGGGISNSPDSQTMEIFITKDYPLVTLVSMIAPSPDWFVGVHGQSLLNEQGDWIEELTVALDPYDAGTDSSPTYLHSENDTNPQEPIRNLRGEAPFDGDSDARIGTFTFERINGPDNPTATPEDTPTNTSTPTDTPTPLPTNTPTPAPTNTSTPTDTPTPLPTNTPTPLPTDTPTTVPTPEPSIAILSPADGADVTLPFMLSVDIQNWPLEPNGRHYHWYVDGELKGPIFSDTAVSVSDLDPGAHTLVVELPEANHDTINISDTVMINVIASMPDPTSQPTDEPTAEPSPTPTDAPTGAQSTDATYQITFDSTWSSETHPGDGTFPSSSAHYSPLIGATHNDSVSLWAPGGIATDGIEQMAETGGTSTLRTEMQAIIDSGSADQIVSGGGLSISPGMLSTNVFTVSSDYPLLSLVTMIAPSPDWFVGIHGLALVDENGEWKTEITATLDPYDAGTDDGLAYVSPNADSDPQQPITNLKGQAPFSDASLGSFTITLMGTTPREGTTPVPGDSPDVELNEKLFLPLTN